MKTKTFFVALLCLIFAVTGCVPTSELYIGKPVTSAPIIEFQKAEITAGTWQTFDVTINYTYTVSGGLIEIAGQGELSQHYQMMYNRVRTMRVYLFLLDADAIILQTAEIQAFLMSTEDKFTFNIPFKANESMKGFSFGYRGVASDMDGQTYFDSLP
ncbi:MAG: hypothetical protein JRE56_08675 [Deltaproteobacteria bacterium]|nr:hypothetical protein [Deltaproteobacteria bacterium]MBW2510789.1 hypothetical protein [Deltaproteobacteria bacterium]MDH4008245.1 hypothetical protein [Desulfuromonadales bacterium]